jgi:putative aldouronate transport system permease protein
MYNWRFSFIIQYISVLSLSKIREVCNVKIDNVIKTEIHTSKKSSFKNTINKVWEYRALYVFLLPCTALFITFSYVPMLGLVMVFQHYDPVSGFLNSPWVGLENFQRIFSAPVFLRALKNTLIISGLKIVVEFPLPIIFALLLNELRSTRFKKTIQTITYMPNFVSWVIVAGVWYSMLSPSGGIINQILVNLHIVKEGIFFMQSKTWFYPIIIFTDVWKTLGFSAILYMASIAGIDVEQYQAACVDGAGRFKQAIYITLPGMKNTIILLLILSFSGILNAGFDQLWTMSNLAVRDVADILDTAVLRTLTSGSLEDLSVGAAMGFFKSFIGLLLFLIANAVSRKFKQESLI